MENRFFQDISKRLLVKLLASKDPAIHREIFHLCSLKLRMPVDKSIVKFPPFKHPLVLISQVQRSGGSLLQMLLDAHPELLVLPSELHLVKGKWPTEELQAVVENPLMWPALIKRSSKILIDYAFGGYHKSGRIEQSERHDFHFLFALQRAILHRHLVRKPMEPLTERYVMDVYFTAFFRSWRNYLGNILREEPLKRYITAFSPRTNLDFWEESTFSEFSSTYPDGHFITMVRHPLDWYMSASVHHEEYSKVAEALSLWERSTKASIGLAEKYPEQVMIVLFEDLIAKPELVMRKVCTRLNLTWHDDLLVPSFNGEKMLSDSSYAPKHGIDSDVIKRRDRAPTEVKQNAAMQEAIALYNQIPSLAS